MTIGSTTIQTSGSTGNGATTQFSFSFNLDPDGYGATTAASQVQVIRETISSGAEEVLTLNTHYTVSVNADQGSSPGGSITMLSAPSSAYKIWIRLNPDFTQQTDYQNQGGFLMETVEDQADQHTRQILALKDMARRAPRVGVQAGQSFDGEITGDLVAGYGPVLKNDLTGWQLGQASAAVSVAMSPVVNASTLALGRLALGLSDAGLPWVNVKDFGALGDVVFNSSGTMTSGTDDTAAIQTAIDYVEATTQGRGTVFFPRGFYKITAKLRIKKGVVLMGAGRGQFHDSTTAVNVNVPDAATGIFWYSAASDKMIHIEPAVTTGRRIAGAGVVGIGLYGAAYGGAKATHGIYARSVDNGEFDFYGQHVTTAAMYLGVVPSADGIVDEARDSQYNRISFGWRNSASDDGSLLILDGDSGANSSKNSIRMDSVCVYMNGDAIDLINCDNNVFIDVYLFRWTAGTGRALRSRGGATAAQTSRGNDFWKFSSGKADGTDPAILFEGFDVATVASTDNVIHLDTENDTPIPTVGPGATLHISTQESHDYFGERYNLVVNGDFALNQLNASSCTDKTAGFDGGVVLTQSNAITISSVSAPENGQAQCLRLTQANASAQRMGYLFVIPSEDTIPHRGSGVALYLRGRLSTTADVRVAIGEWTGTADALAADVVADWTSTTYTTAGFFTSTTQNVLCVYENAMTANTWRDMSGAGARGGATATVGSSANNLWVLVWTEGTAAQNDTLDLGKVRLVAGFEPMPSLREDRATTIQRAERQVQKSYNIAVAPGTSFAQGAPAFTSRAADQSDRWTVYLRGRMFKNPTRTVYSTTGASGNVRNLSGAADVTADTADQGEGGFVVYPTANTASGSIYSFHWTCTAYPWT